MARCRGGDRKCDGSTVNVRVAESSSIATFPPHMSWFSIDVSCGARKVSKGSLPYFMLCTEMITHVALQ